MNATHIFEADFQVVQSALRFGGRETSGLVGAPALVATGWHALCALAERLSPVKRPRILRVECLSDAESAAGGV